MFFAPNPGILAAGVQGSGKTYDQFVAHIEALAGGAARGWLDSVAWSTSGAAVVTTANTAPSGGMTGSSWMAPFWGAAAGVAATCRVVQHGLSDETSFNDQIAESRKILIRTDGATAPSGYASKTRNGYTSLANATTAGARICTEILAWINGQPMRMQPYLGLGPEPYDW